MSLAQKSQIVCQVPRFILFLVSLLIFRFSALSFSGFAYFLLLLHPAAGLRIRIQVQKLHFNFETKYYNHL